MLVAAPEEMGEGAIHVVLDGRVAKPEITLLALEERADDKGAEELAALADDCAVTIDDEGLLSDPELPPPQESKHIKLVISSIFFTLAFIAITSQ